jgi:peptide/nickel transport system ATP-binding protein/oligopeptide transport system ATP-binding protein
VKENSRDTTPLLDVRGLTVSFTTDEGRILAVDNVSLSIGRDEIFGLVGESGCGKSVTAMSVLKLVPTPPGRIESGRIMFDGRDLLAAAPADLRAVRGKRVSMVFQEPMTALSPLRRVGDQLVEAVLLHGAAGRAGARTLAREWMGRVGIPDAAERMYAYPHQLSGGMRQRVMIAMALILDPDLVIADEPTTALDVTIQAQIFDLMRGMRRPGTSILLITHDMAVIWEICTRMAVMYASEIVEEGPVDRVFERPAHPYTEGLLNSIPARTPPGNRLKAIAGQVPVSTDYPTGCRFRDRCPCAFDRCAREHPQLADLAWTRRARCFLAGERVGSGQETKSQ